MRVLFSIFVIAPILEMWLLIEVGGLIGALPTIACVLLTALIGATLLRQQGVSTLLRARQRLDHGEVPAREILEGLMLAIGGALLLTPGFITDAVGFVCLIRPLRNAVIDQMLRRGVIQMQAGGFSASSGPRGNSSGAEGRREPGHITIEGECRKED